MYSDDNRSYWQAMVKDTMTTLSLFLFISLLTGCALRSSHPASTEENCIVTTGERDYHAEILLAPDEILQPGQSIKVHFTGGYYMVLPSCKIVDGEAVYHYPTVKELSNEVRNVDIFLDEIPISSVECGFDCEVSFSLPDTLRTGNHHLNFRARTWVFQPKDLAFEFIILE
jgi:hypothetical protein